MKQTRLPVNFRVRTRFVTYARDPLATPVRQAFNSTRYELCECTVVECKEKKTIAAADAQAFVCWPVIIYHRKRGLSATAWARSSGLVNGLPV